MPTDPVPGPLLYRSPPNSLLRKAAVSPTTALAGAGGAGLATGASIPVAGAFTFFMAMGVLGMAHDLIRATFTIHQNGVLRQVSPFLPGRGWYAAFDKIRDFSLAKDTGRHCIIRLRLGREVHFEHVPAAISTLVDHLRHRGIPETPY